MDKKGISIEKVTAVAYFINKSNGLENSRTVQDLRKCGTL